MCFTIFLKNYKKQHLGNTKTEVIFLDKNKNKEIKTPSMINNDGQPENAFEQINFYGTYNIQPTQVSDNTYPAIGQGLDEATAERLRKESARWKKEESN